MAEALEASEPPLLINLKVLSPSGAQDMSLADIPAATTVKDLRLRIQSEIASRPSPDRMRLIYRGRAVVNDQDTLLNVFGPDNIRDSKDQTLHLVLRELQPASTVSSPGPTPVPELPPSRLPSLGAAPPTQPLPHQRPNSQPPPSQPHTHAHGHPHHHHVHPHSHHHHHGPQLPQLQQPQQPQQPGNPFAANTPLGSLLQQQIQALAHNTPQNTASEPHSRTGTPLRAATPQGPAPPPPPRPLIPPSLLPPNSTRTIRTETLGPNGERVTVSYNTTNFTIPLPQQHPILPRPFPHPLRTLGAVPPGPMAALRTGGESVEQLLARIRVGLQTARQEMENVAVLLRTPSAAAGAPGQSRSPLPWRMDTVRQHMQNLGQELGQIQQTLSALALEPSMALSSSLGQLQQTANDIRGQADSVNSMLDRLHNDGTSSEASSQSSTSGAASSTASTSSTPDSTSQVQSLQGSNNVTPPEGRPELFLLSGPQGPVGILFDQQGTYSTAPLVPTMPFQSFTNQFAANRQRLAGMSQHMGQTTQTIHNRLAAAGLPTPTPPQPAAGVNTPQNQLAPQAQEQNQNGNQAQAPAPAPAAAEDDQLARWAAHFWLIFKLACFVYIFAGYGSWYRPLIIAFAALMTYLVQLGLFENRMNRIRQHFEALLPVGPQPGPQPLPRAQGANAPAAQGEGHGQGQGQRGQRMTPEQAAQRLLQQHREQNLGWVRESIRTVERAFALFVASLWPGVGERMVHAQEERERAERAAEEEARQRQEEERRRQQEQLQSAEQQAQPSAAEKKEDETPAESSMSSAQAKGKEKDEGPEGSASTATAAAAAAAEGGAGPSN